MQPPPPQPAFSPQGAPPQNPFSQGAPQPQPNYAPPMQAPPQPGYAPQPGYSPQPPAPGPMVYTVQNTGPKYDTQGNLLSDLNWFCCKCSFEATCLFKFFCIMDCLLVIGSIFYAIVGMFGLYVDYVFASICLAIAIVNLLTATYAFSNILYFNRNRSDGTFQTKAEQYVKIRWSLFVVNILYILLTSARSHFHQEYVCKRDPNCKDISLIQNIFTCLTTLAVEIYFMLVFQISLRDTVKVLSGAAPKTAPMMQNQIM